MECLKLTGKLSIVNIEPLASTATTTFEIREKADIMQAWLAAKDTLLEITLKQYRKKRSLNANAYAWELITKIANVLRATKEDIYFQMLKKYGQSELISIISDAKIDGYIKYYDEAGESTLNGKRFKHYRVYKGSSEFDTQEMAILIDGIVSDAKELNIQTEPPEEIERIKSLWKEG